MYKRQQLFLCQPYSGPGDDQLVRRHGKRGSRLPGQPKSSGADAAAFGGRIFSKSGPENGNTVLLLTGAEEHPATLDLACVDLHSGVLEMMKLGAAATFVISQDGVEAIEAGEVPAGIISPVEPVLLSKKLWDENWIVMVSDGVLDGLPGEDKEGILKEYLSDMEETTPQELAEEILEFVISYSDGVRDDMTVLTARVWKRK